MSEFEFDLEAFADMLTGMAVYATELYKYGHVVSVYESGDKTVVLFSEGLGYEDIEIDANKVILASEMECEMEKGDR